jgi:hypothetical protein
MEEKARIRSVIQREDGTYEYVIESNFPLGKEGDTL